MKTKAEIRNLIGPYGQIGLSYQQGRDEGVRALEGVYKDVAGGLCNWLSALYACSAVSRIKDKNFGKLGFPLEEVGGAPQITGKIGLFLTHKLSPSAVVQTAGFDIVTENKDIPILMEPEAQALGIGLAIEKVLTPEADQAIAWLLTIKDGDRWHMMALNPKQQGLALFDPNIGLVTYGSIKDFCIGFGYLIRRFYMLVMGMRLEKFTLMSVKQKAS